MPLDGTESGEWDIRCIHRPVPPLSRGLRAPGRDAQGRSVAARTGCRRVLPGSTQARAAFAVRAQARSHRCARSPVSPCAGGRRPRCRTRRMVADRTPGAPPRRTDRGARQTGDGGARRGRVHSGRLSPGGGAPSAGGMRRPANGRPCNVGHGAQSERHASERPGSLARARGRCRPLCGRRAQARRRLSREAVPGRGDGPVPADAARTIRRRHGQKAGGITKAIERILCTGTWFEPL